MGHIVAGGSRLQSVASKVDGKVLKAPKLPFESVKV